MDTLLQSLLPPDYVVVSPHLKPYLLASFGSFARMDYGTGHETSFALFLLGLTLTRFFQPAVEEERNLVLVVFVRYLRLCWRLQDVYRLEPAGSHGVWGLDDSSFLGYIFGSAQLRGSSFPQSYCSFLLIMYCSRVRSNGNTSFSRTSSSTALNQPVFYVHHAHPPSQARPFP